MAIALIQDSQNANITVTSVTVTLPGTATAGNLLVAGCVYRADMTLTDPTDFTLIVDRQAPVADQRVDTAIFYKVAVGGEQAIVFTLNTTGFLGGWVGEYSGLATSSVVDVFNSNAIDSTVTSVSSGTTAVTAQAEELAVAIFGVRNSDVTSRSYTNSFTEQGSTNAGAVITIAAAHKILSATGAQETTLSWSGTAARTTAVIATFKASSENVIALHAATALYDAD